MSLVAAVYNYFKLLITAWVTYTTQDFYLNSAFPNL